jgi:hypothetical protein
MGLGLAGRFGGRYPGSKTFLSVVSTPADIPLSPSLPPPLPPPPSFNFLGAFATLIALFAQVGSLMVSKSGSLSTEALCQAASNTLLAHIVSLAFLMVVTRKITQAYQKVRAVRAGDAGRNRETCQTRPT